MTVILLCKTMGSWSSVRDKRPGKINKHFDYLAEDDHLSKPTSKQTYLMLDINQIGTIFKGMNDWTNLKPLHRYFYQLYKKEELNYKANELYAEIEDIKAIFSETKYCLLNCGG